MRLSNSRSDFWSIILENGSHHLVGSGGVFQNFVIYRVIYTDVDMINLKDISKLIEIDMQGKPMLQGREIDGA